MQGKLFAAIESGNETQFNNLCSVPKTGMLFIANENSKIQTHYIPVCLIIYLLLIIQIYNKINNILILNTFLCLELGSSS